MGSARSDQRTGDPLPLRVERVFEAVLLVGSNGIVLGMFVKAATG